jgi:hypothetical protein
MAKGYQGRGTLQLWVRIVVMIVVLLVASVGSGHARGGSHGFGGHHGFRGHHGFGGPHVVFGVSSYWGPYWPPYAYPPVVVAPPAAVYVEPSPPTSVPPQHYWYYCDNPQGYYPYVQQCPGGWRPVTPTPP